MERPSTQPTGTSPSWSGGFRRRIPFYILLAILLSLVSAVLTFLYLDQIRSHSLPTLAAVVARRDIPPGTLITADDIALREVPPGIVPANSMLEIERTLGRITLSAMHENEVILLSDLAGGEKSGLSNRLPDGRWAMILPAAWLVSPVPAVVEGDTLDLMAYLAGQSREQLGMVVSAVELIAFTGSTERPEYLTLAVSQEQAKAILYARANGFSLLVLLRPAGS